MNTFVASLLATATLAEQISCPVLYCENPKLDGPVTYDLCWESDEQQPMGSMRSFGCNWYPENEKSNFELGTTTVCDISLLNGQAAWVDETTQGISSQDESNSQIQGRRSEAYCREVGAFQ
jgi:hypothetical protein